MPEMKALIAALARNAVLTHYVSTHAPQKGDIVMSTELVAPTETLSNLKRILGANDTVDWRTMSFDDPSQLQALQWQGHDNEQEALLLLLKGYQRLIRILPIGEEARALPMLGAGLHSAVQIAGLPKREFVRRWEALFPGEAALGEAVHGNALARRSQLVLHHINAVQCNEPHYRAARFR